MSTLAELSAPLRRLLEEGLTGARPLFAGAVAALSVGDGTVVLSVGEARRYADTAGRLLPPAERPAVTDDTLFDLASVTKLFTATVVVRLADDGVLGLDDPVARFLPTYAGGARAAVTLRSLLTHTSGLPADSWVWRDQPDVDARRAALLEEPLVTPPGRVRLYSCVGYLVLGLLLEEVTGRSLDVLVEELVCGPLGMTRTGYRPRNLAGTDDQAGASAGAGRDGIAATELRRVTWSPDHDPAEPDLRGIVHDEKAASLGGVAGNAGLFGTAADLLAFGRALLTAPRAGGRTPLGLSAAAARALVTPQLPAELDLDYRSGLGFRIDDPEFMGALAGAGRTYGHTGFTGTSLVVDEARDLVLVLLSNRVHPDRSWSELNPFRRRLAELASTGASGRAQAAVP